MELIQTTSVDWKVGFVEGKSNPLAYGEDTPVEECMVAKPNRVQSISSGFETKQYSLESVPFTELPAVQLKFTFRLLVL